MARLKMVQNVWRLLRYSIIHSVDDCIIHRGMHMMRLWNLRIIETIKQIRLSSKSNRLGVIKSIYPCRMATYRLRAHISSPERNFGKSIKSQISTTACLLPHPLLPQIRCAELRFAPACASSFISFVRPLCSTSGVGPLGRFELQERRKRIHYKFLPHASISE